MMRVLMVIACVLVSGLASAQPERSYSPAEQEVLAVVDRFMHAVTNADAREFDALQLEGVFATIQHRDGRIERRLMSSMSLGAGGRERYWDPTVLVRQNIAVVWTPYELWFKGQTVHCGVDVFDLAKQDGVWRIAHAMFTMEPDACPQLRPKDPSRIRPPG